MQEIYKFFAFYILRSKQNLRLMVEKFAKGEPNIVHCTSWTEDTVHKAEPGYFVLNVCVRDLDKALFLQLS